MNLYFQLFVQFFHIGVFSFGGGYATLPFLFDIARNFEWFTPKQLTDMIAISSITPGPVGINAATFAGFTTSGIAGALIATSAIILPSFIIVSIVSKFLDKFNSNKNVQGALKGIKPAGCALLSAVGIKLLFTSNLNIAGIILLVVFLLISTKKKLDPLYYLSISAVFGAIFAVK